MDRRVVSGYGYAPYAASWDARGSLTWNQIHSGWETVMGRGVRLSWSCAKGNRTAVDCCLLGGAALGRSGGRAMSCRWSHIRPTSSLTAPCIRLRVLCRPQFSTPTYRGTANPKFDTRLCFDRRCRSFLRDRL
jgi:hypothetical protein